MMIVIMGTFLILWWILWLFPWYMVTNRMKKMLFIILLLLVSVTGTGVVYYFYNSFYPHVVIDEEQPLFMGPDASYIIIGKIEKNRTVRLLGKCQSWVKVKQLDGTVGWLPEANIKMVKNV